MFGWLKKLFFRNKEEEEDFDWERDPLGASDRERVDFDDPRQAEAYVRVCCEQMKEATEEIEGASLEFNAVTERLRDIEEIESLPEDQRRLITEYARALLDSYTEREGFMNRRDIMPETQYRQIERHEGELPDAIGEFKKNEDYKSLVKKDLKNLEGEKMSCRFRRNELRGREETLKNLVTVALVTVVFTMGVLVFLQFGMGMSVTVGYLLCVAAASVALTAVFINYSNVHREKKRMNRRLNQVIILQNRVKIRYVNVTGLIDYFCAKFGANSSDELSYLWGRYLKEKKERERFKEVDERAGESAARLLELLKENRVKKPEVWIHQAKALVDRREMVEIRHELIARRGSLRKRINYNEENRQSLRDEVKDLAVRYPRIAPMIIDVVDDYS